MHIDIALVAYLIDWVVGEFGFVRHPVVVMGDAIGWFERRFYRDSVWRGAWLVLVVISGVWLAALGLAWGVDAVLSRADRPLLYVLFIGTIASTTLASKMLYDSVHNVIAHPETIRYLVSRDTDVLTPSEIHKAAIETYAENLSDGVIAPLFYLVLFGLPGAFVYKAINTLDSMVGYRNARYERFGKVSARLDDIANYIPARITAVLITLLMPATPLRTPLPKIIHQAKGHASPNAGYPISAMGYALGIRLGGETSYFGTVKPKPWFGEGREELVADDIRRALSLQHRLDGLIMVLLAGGAMWG
jgi:adenosylcobinamide-phosphate synthase